MHVSKLSFSDSLATMMECVHAWSVCVCVCVREMQKGVCVLVSNNGKVGVQGQVNVIHRSSQSYPTHCTITHPRFALEIARFVCDRATTIENKKLRSKGVAMHAYSVSAYYACTGNQLQRTQLLSMVSLEGGYTS